MARSNYSKYEYETSPRKLEPYYAPKKKITEVKRETVKIKISCNRKRKCTTWSINRKQLKPYKLRATSKNITWNAKVNK